MVSARWSGAQWPAYGLVVLATRLRLKGYNPLVVDYNHRPEAPPLEDLIRDFKPSIIGFSLYTINMKESRTLIARARAVNRVPIVLGGPHASLYHTELAKSCLGDWIFVGEADESFPGRIGDIKTETSPVVVSEAPPDILAVPKADFSLAWGGYSKMVYRPIQLSRGCPYGCSFCSVKCITSRRIRYRDSACCLDEIEHDFATNPALSFVRIVDDCPTFDLPRFKQFLRDYIARGVGKPFHIDNLRGDRIDDEMLVLLKRIGVDHLCIGVETGNTEVFRLINKGETLDEVIASAEKIKSHGIRLYACFIIGLPGASPATEMDSIALVRRLKPNWVFWNLFQPHRGTEARRWFEEHGRVYTEEGKTSLAGIDLSATEAPCDTVEYPMDERTRMQLMASLMTGCYLLNPFWLVRISKTIARYKLWKAFLIGLPSAVRVNVEMVVQRIRRLLKSKRWVDLSGFRVPRVFGR